MKTKMTLGLLVATLSLTALAQPPGSDRSDEGGYKKASTKSQVVGAQNEFGAKLFGQVSRSNETNIFLSPISASLALSMAANGARGETEAGMLKALQLSQVSKQDVNTGNQALMTDLTQRVDGFTVQIANSIWVRQGFYIYPSFIKQAQDSYQADVQNLDFSDPSASTTINGWVSAKTNGKITSIVPSRLPADSRVYLINATYLKADWLTPFKPIRTRDATFTLIDKNKTSVKMMSNHGNYNYVEADSYQAIELPYKGGTASMIVVLPKDGQFSKVQTAFTQNLLTDVTNALQANGGTQKYGFLELPKFTITAQNDLTSSLVAMGMDLAFTQKADFGALSSQALNITGVLQKIYIAVDEKGTEAAAVTSVGYGATAMPQRGFTIVVNQPFFVYIRDTRSGAVLFQGRVMNPAL